MSTNRDEVAGKVKQAAGDLTDNEDLKREGKEQETAGKAKQAVEDAADSVKDGVDKIKNKFS